MDDQYPKYDDTYEGRTVKLQPLSLPQQNGIKKRKKKRNKADKKKAKKATQTIVPKRIDYVLVYPKETKNDFNSDDDVEDFKMRVDLRERYKQAAKETEGLKVSERDMGEKIYVLIHCPFWRMCQEAEDVNLEMPLKGAAVSQKEVKGILGKLRAAFITDDEVDFISAPFCVEKRAVFKGVDQSDTFFSPALRTLLVHNILINIDVREQDDKGINLKESMRRKGLPYMLMKKVYTDGFALHEESPYELDNDVARELHRSQSKERGDFDPSADTREAMHRTWCQWWKFQPLWKIRNYFGVKIAFYFAWAGEMASLLWVPVFLGIGIWMYGLFLSIKENVEYNDRLEENQMQRDAFINELQANVTLYNRTEDAELYRNLTGQGSTEDSFFSSIADKSLEAVEVFQNSFDSIVTPYFALIICLWGTIFQESWKRKHSRLAYEWDVDSYHFAEPDRPEFYGTKEREDPVSDLPDWYYPFHRQFLKFMASFGILIFMALLVVASVLGVIVYRVIMSVLLSESSSTLRIMLSTVVATLMNSVSIMILGRIYDYIAYKLTNWENHRTQSQYDDAVIIKLFAFQFVNSYASLFYIAFFRGLTHEDGFLYLGEQYNDSCGDKNQCMPLLSLQVFVLMIMKPFPKFLKDVIVPWIKKLLHKCMRCMRRNNVCDVEADKMEKVDFIHKEGNKPQLGNFTLGEFTEKTIQYGFLMLFSCALPLAPLIAILVLLVDIRVDAARMLWMNRRPVAFIAGGIGMWFSILDFINFAGVVTNGFLIAFTAKWAQGFTIADKLWVVIGFEHIVFSVKFFIAYVIPDTPSDITLAKRRERYQIAQIMHKAELQGPITSKECTSSKPVPYFKAFNYVDCIVNTDEGNDSPTASCVEREKNTNKNNADEDLGNSSDDDGARQSHASLDDAPPTLSYAADGSTYIGAPEKFPSESKKKKKKRPKKQNSKLSLNPQIYPVYPLESNYRDGYQLPTSQAELYGMDGYQLDSNLLLQHDLAYPPNVSYSTQPNIFI